MYILCSEELSVQCVEQRLKLETVSQCEGEMKAIGYLVKKMTKHYCGADIVEDMQN